MQILIERLSKKYKGGKYALRDIDLKINSGMFGLLGPNGAGKTTLMRILVTLLDPTSGSVKIDDYDLKKNRKEIRQMTGYLPQDFSNFSKLAVWEFLDYTGALSGLTNKKERMAKIDQLLDGVGLFDVRDRQAKKLSGGMKRRLGIAQTLICDPRIMVVDEPTVGLDPQERLRFRNLMADLSSKDMIIILSTHIVGDISSSCHDLAILNSGKIVYSGSPDRLTANSEGKVWKLIASDHELEQLRNKYPVISAVPGENGFEVRVVAEKIENLQAQQIDPNIEDAYIYFMQSIGTDMDLESDGNQI